MAGRFSFSVPERRHFGDPWFRVGEFDITTTILVTLGCVVSLLVWAADELALARLALIPSEVRGGEVWRVLTWPLANIPDNRALLWTVITIALFWYFGREVEGLLGRNRFAVFLVVLTVVTGVVGTVIDAFAFGIRPIEFAVFLVFVAQHPFARFFFGIPAWVLGAVLLAIEVLQLVADNNGRGIVLLFVTLATAAVLARSWGIAENLPWVPALPLDRSERRPRRARPARRQRGGGDVVAGPWSSATRGGPSRVSALPQPPPPNAAHVADQAELDSLLDKIAAGGMDSLNGDEKRRLNDLSKRMRGSR